MFYLSLALLSTTTLCEGQQYYELPIEYQINPTNFDFVQNTPHEIDTELPDSYPIDNTYDFIIVGAGTAGSVIANRLSEISDWKILLLEVGYPEGNLGQIPLLAPYLQLTDYNWDYTMEPQKNVCLAMTNQQCGWPRGRALGGSTVINYMVYIRGNPKDYDKWESLGNPGWSYQDVLPYFLKSEDSRLEEFNPIYHNEGGYLSVENPHQSHITKAFLQAVQEFGYRIVDYNSPDQLGFSRIQATIKHGRRHSVAKAFLEPIASRKNLEIVTGARVLKILINPVTKSTIGVEYVKGNEKFIVKVTKEVILCAGVFNSPQLLMLSGIGPKEHLDQLGIPLLVDLPVGQTLYDHLSFSGLIFNTNTTTGVIAKLFDPRELRNWFEYGTGPFTSLGGFEALGYVNTNPFNEHGDYPDIEILLSGVGDITTDYGLLNRRTLKISDNYYYRMFSSLESQQGFTAVPLLLHPKSKGYMKLRSTNPYDYPLLYGNYLTDPEEQDTRTLIAGIRLIIKLIEGSEAFKKYNTHLERKLFLGCEHFEFDSDDYWKCALQFMATTLYHQTSTCKMGPADDSTSVVNHELRVYGIGNLRVADSSIIPVTVSAHTSAPTIMVGEKASDLIKNFWGVL
ncbi:hypothetical protein ILUMI_27238 [Ignelater luminosus]|uniref:Glucose-methanol-choline oxidoreductase N-terminal domain-containing protein n=1 Tax=Ignelater luminosus TaxID=2038154 RepID=A0A8K0C3P0_IGNLU|nr:hypothetical protein ILUMI_27238 [Ignelater luminosus]